MNTTLVCLHGWGGSQASFRELLTALDGVPNVQILTPDLPGFGAKPEPKKPWTIDDYADWVEDYIQQHRDPHARALVILGHSHGGRIALMLAARQARKTQRARRTTTIPPIDRLFLCAPAGIRHARHFRRIIGLTLAKSGKLLCAIPGLATLAPLGKRLLYRLVRVHDYERASPIMRETLIRVSRQDLRPLLKDIRTPTELFWGKDDRMTPFGDARIMEREIPGAILHAFAGIRHAVHRERAAFIAARIRAAFPLPSL